MPPSTSKEFRFSKNKHPNLKDANNTTVDETCDKCGETEDTVHLFLEYVQYQEKNMENIPTALKQSTKTSTYQGTSKKTKTMQISWKKISIMNKILVHPRPL